MPDGITRGVKNALARQAHHSVCKECGFPLPKYPGRYPKCCPSCGCDRVAEEAVDEPFIVAPEVGGSFTLDETRYTIVEIDGDVAYGEAPDGSTADIPVR